MTNNATPSDSNRSFGVITVAMVALCAIAGWILWGLRSGTARDDDAQAVILYTSADDEIARSVLEAFTAQTGVRVRVVGDTEATKSTGLAQRLLDERASVRADVWWSSEPLGSVRLAREGVLDTTWPGPGDAVGDDERPDELKGKGWRGIAQRSRVLIANTNRVKPDAMPRTLRALTDPAWKGQVGLAKPQFGTTRSHLAYLVHRAGAAATRAWLEGLRANGVRLYDGNAAVTRAVAYGEVTLGVVDFDDAQEALHNRWPVALAFEAPDPPGFVGPGLPSFGTLLLPNTVGVVAQAPHPTLARQLADFLCSPKVEEVMASHTSGHIPVREPLRRQFAQNIPPNPAPLASFDPLEDAARTALTLVDEVFSGSQGAASR